MKREGGASQNTRRARAGGRPLPVGRPRKTEVDPAIAKAICDNLELAMPLDLAAEAEGVGRSTVRGWMNDYPEFSGRVTRARAQGMKNLVVRSLKGGPGSSQATWHLERRYREDYGPPKNDLGQPKVEITIHGGLPKRQLPVASSPVVLG